MKKTLMVIIALILVAFPVVSSAQILGDVKARTHILNLESKPLWFQSGQPVDFVVTIRYDSFIPQGGFDVGVFHEGRVVGWELNKTLHPGKNTFRLRDANFTGDPGNYTVRIRFAGDIFTEKRFATRRVCGFTLDPKASPFWR